MAIIVQVGHGTPDQPISLFPNPDSQNPPCHVSQTQNLLHHPYVSSAITVMFSAIVLQLTHHCLPGLSRQQRPLRRLLLQQVPRCCRYHIVKNVGTARGAIIGQVGHGTPDQPRPLFTNPDLLDPSCHVSQTPNSLQHPYVSSAKTVMFSAIL